MPVVNVANTGAEDACAPGVLAEQWRLHFVARHAQMNESTVRIVSEFCRSVATFNTIGRCGPRTLLSRLVAAGRLGLAVHAAMPDWSPGQCWQRDIDRTDALAEIWHAYRRARDLYSPALERLLIESMVCRDLRRSHGLAPAAPGAQPWRRHPGGRLLPLAGVVTVGGGWLGWSALPATMPPWAAAGFAVSAAVGLGLWWIGPRLVGRNDHHRKLAMLTASLRALLGTDARLRPNAAALARAIAQGAGLGIRWQADTIAVLTHLRSSTRARLSMPPEAHLATA